MPPLVSYPFSVDQDVKQKIKRDFLSTYLGTNLYLGNNACYADCQKSREQFEGSHSVILKADGDTGIWYSGTCDLAGIPDIQFCKSPCPTSVAVCQFSKPYRCDFPMLVRPLRTTTPMAH